MFEDFVLPNNRSQWNLRDDYINLCNRCQTHGSLVNGVRCCNPAQCFRKGSCRFHFPYAVTGAARAFIEGRGSNARKTFAAVHNDPWLNQHARVVLLGWRANVDMQPVLDREAARRYISKYASKPGALSQSYHTALQDFCSRLPGAQPAECAVQRLFARMAADRDISAQEAVHLLLGEPLVGCSRSFVNLNGEIDAPRLLREPLDRDDDDDAFEETFFSHYQNRPTYLTHLNAVQFCMNHSVSQRQSFRPSKCENHPLTVLIRKWCQELPSAEDGSHRARVAAHVLRSCSTASSFRTMGFGSTASLQTASLRSRAFFSVDLLCLR